MVNVIAGVSALPSPDTQRAHIQKVLGYHVQKVWPPSHLVQGLGCWGYDVAFSVKGQWSRVNGQGSRVNC